MHKQHNNARAEREGRSLAVTCERLHYTYQMRTKTHSHTSIRTKVQILCALLIDFLPRMRRFISFWRPCKLFKSRRTSRAGGEKASGHTPPPLLAKHRMQNL
jgi:hypothetical protein